MPGQGLQPPRASVCTPEPLCLCCVSATTAQPPCVCVCPAACLGAAAQPPAGDQWLGSWCSSIDMDRELCSCPDMLLPAACTASAAEACPTDWLASWVDGFVAGLGPICRVGQEGAASAAAAARPPDWATQRRAGCSCCCPEPSGASIKSAGQPLLRLRLPSSTCTPQAGFHQDSASSQIVPSRKETRPCRCRSIPGGDCVTEEGVAPLGTRWLSQCRRNPSSDCTDEGGREHLDAMPAAPSERHCRQ